MATLNDRYWNSGDTVMRGFIVSFVNKIGKRQTASFSEESAAQFFWSEICKKEQRWKADRLLVELEGHSNV